MNDILRIARLKIALQRAFLGRAILRVIKKNINHSIALKNWPSLWSKPNQKSVNLQKFDVLISEDQLAVSDGKFWRLELMIPKNVHNQISCRD